MVHCLKSGMLARAALPVGERVMATLVPKDAIVLGGPQPMVVIVNGAANIGETGTPAPVPVQLGVAYRDWIQVTGSVKAGQLVVVQGNERIRPGQQVTISRIVGPPAEESEPVVVGRTTQVRIPTLRKSVREKASRTRSICRWLNHLFAIR